MSSLEIIKAEILRAAQGSPSPTRPEYLRSVKRALMLAALGSLATFAVFGGLRTSARPLPMLLAVSALLALLAALATWMALRPARSSLERPLWITLLVVALTPLLAFAVTTLGAAIFEHDQAVPERPGLRCFALTLLFAAPPLIAAVAARRHHASLHPSASAAIIGVAVGSWSALLVELWCPVGHWLHVALGHAAPVYLLSAIAYVAAKRMQ